MLKEPSIKFNTKIDKTLEKHTKMSPVLTIDEIKQEVFLLISNFFYNIYEIIVN